MKEVKDALKILIQGEVDAVEHYKAFSKKAAEEGFKNISILFKSLAAAEKIHIKNHYNALGEEFITKPVENIKMSSTIDNISAALYGEIEESNKLYPRLIKSIKKYRNDEYGKVAKLSMSWARSVEREHAKLLKIALKEIKSGKDMFFENLAICQVCGNIVMNKFDDKECRICGHDSIFFESVSMEGQ